MLITGKVANIEKPNPQRDVFVVELSKTRRSKKISIAVTVWGRLAERIEEIKIGERWDFQVYLQSKARVYQGRNYWDSWIMAERMRKYVKGAERSVTVANQETGEVITKRKGEIPI